MITDLYRYPIKGFSAEPLETMELIAGEGLVGDRHYAVARQPDAFDPQHPKAQPKHKFIVLLRDAALAALKTQFDPATQLLTIREPGGASDHYTLSDTGDCARLEAFLKDYIGGKALTPTLVSAAGHKFTDISVASEEKMRAISLINVKSVEALEAAAGSPVHPLRFRANVYFTGVPAWQEFDWVGREIMIGDARAKVVMCTQRCAATEVDPDTGERDLNVPALIKRHFGHFDMGVYAQIISTGHAEIGAPISRVK